MPTLLIKNVPDELLKELRKLKAETGCKTWADLLSYLVKSREKAVVVMDEEYTRKARDAINEFLELKAVVSKSWRESSVLEEFRRARRHGNSDSHARR